VAHCLDALTHEQAGLPGSGWDGLTRHVRVKLSLWQVEAGCGQVLHKTEATAEIGEIITFLTRPQASFVAKPSNEFILDMMRGGLAFSRI